MIKKFFFLLSLVFIYDHVAAQPSSRHDLHFDQLANRWDEAIPLGNGMLGALIWQKDGQLHFSLDRADLWDQRPMKGLHRKEFSYQWVIEQVNKKDYGIVQKYFDEPYDTEPAPSKIPGGALEFDTRNWGKVKSVNLSVKDALCEVKWTNGSSLKTFVSADKSLGWFKFENLSGDVDVELVAPQYQGQVKNSGDPVGGDDLSRLGYPKGTIVKEEQNITYDQKGWGGFSYQINVRWKKTGNTLAGTWSISSNSSAESKNITAKEVTAKATGPGFKPDFIAHQNWWKQFWKQSAIQIPDTLLEKQWYLEQ
ncbi:glycoside hydrolase N-terminal domain-containing protein [Pedobacter sp. NJ-S-72]